MSTRVLACHSASRSPGSPTLWPVLGLHCRVTSGRVDGPLPVYPSISSGHGVVATSGVCAQGHHRWWMIQSHRHVFVAPARRPRWEVGLPVLQQSWEEVPALFQSRGAILVPTPVLVDSVSPTLLTRVLTCRGPDMALTVPSMTSDRGLLSWAHWPFHLSCRQGSIQILC